MSRKIVGKITSSKDGHLRSIVKAISYRTCAAVATSTIVFVFTRKVVLSVGIGLVEAVVKVIFYYLHERVWSYINIGKKEHPLSSLPVDRPLEDKDMEVIKSKLKDLGYLQDD
jgi:uncharacterized membrane protein